MTDDLGRRVSEAGPSTPVELLGLSDVPSAGDPLHAVRDAKRAQEIAESRRTKAAMSAIAPSAKVSLESITRRMAEAHRLELRIILKADVQGSVEALSGALSKLSTQQVGVVIPHSGVGGITEGDVNLAAAAGAIVVGFNVRPTGKAAALADSQGVEIRLYEVVYDVLDDVRKAMVGLLAPRLVERRLGLAEVRQTFKLPRLGVIAGCMVTEGSLVRGGKARLLRDDAKVWDGRIAGLRRFKDDVSRVDRGMECGVQLDGYGSERPGDLLECYEVQQIAATLDSAA
jgi:translation initiation factor IF-2